VISAADALKRILDSVVPLGTEKVPAGEARGRVLASDMVAREDVPPADVATMDGYAVRAADVANTPVTLTLLGEIPAGSSATSSLPGSGAMRIMTGAPTPGGCTAVVQKEWTEMAGPGSVTVLRPAVPGHNIRPRGTDISQGSTVLRKGTGLRPQELGVLASLGVSAVEVSARPRVCVLSTGNELVQTGASLATGKIRDSCSPLLVALAEETGCRARSLGIAGDNLQELLRGMAEGFVAADVLITSGGVSVGEYDLVGQAARELGVDIGFWKVNIKPGMPLLFGTKERSLFFGLPGNPVSAMVTFLEFVRPALRAMMASADSPVRLHATLGHSIRKSDGKLHYMRGIVEPTVQDLVVRSTGLQDSGMLTSLTKANCLIIVPAETDELREGQKVEIELL
jgi:molybdopterin molybdotransferase